MLQKRDFKSPFVCVGGVCIHKINLRKRVNPGPAVVDLSLWLLNPGGGGYSWEFLVGVCRPVSSNPDPISDQKM